MRHVAAAISLLAGIVILGTASSAQVSRRLFKVGGAERKGNNRDPPGGLKLRCRTTFLPRGPCIFELAQGPRI